MNGVTPLLDPAACRGRQARLLAALADRDLDAIVVVSPEHIEYLTGHRWDDRFRPLAAILADGSSLLVCPDKPAVEPAADEDAALEREHV